MKTIKTYTDGGRVVEALGVEISANRNGSVNRLSDWGRTDELVAAGVLRREVWKGSGLYGHDTYFLEV